MVKTCEFANTDSAHLSIPLKTLWLKHPPQHPSDGCLPASPRDHAGFTISFIRPTKHGCDLRQLIKPGRGRPRRDYLKLTNRDDALVWSRREPGSCAHLERALHLSRYMMPDSHPASKWHGCLAGIFAPTGHPGGTRYGEHQCEQTSVLGSSTQGHT